MTTQARDIYYEECPRCNAGGTLDENGQMYICDQCQGEGYVEHGCPPRVVIDSVKIQAK